MKCKKVISAVVSAVMLAITAAPVYAQNNVYEYGDDAMFDLFSENPLEDITLPYTADGYKIAGNITLPETVGGNSVIWLSSDENIINTVKTEFTEEEQELYGENYTEIPPGKVTRPTDADKEITLTAKTTKDGTEYKKDFIVTVKKAPEKNYAQMDEDGDFKGYLYASFIEPPKDAFGQQVYFASSDDGRNWMDLNNNKPVLTSSMGTGSTRDHYIVRSPEGDRFYIIATDLNAFESGKTWDDFAECGSKFLMIWESDDLVNWSAQRMVQVADDNTGCVWAPEAVYDELTGEYIVYWSGHDINEDSENYSNKVVYYSKTRDFYSFTPQEQYVIPLDTDGTADGTSRSFIDTTMIKGDDNRFYRVTKYEETSPTRVFMDVSDYPLGTFTRVTTNLSDNDFLGTEGPGWFKYNQDDAEMFGAKYCLMLDGYNGPNAGVGFFPTTIEGLNGGDNFTFTKLTSDFTMRTAAKHGGIIPLTQEEFDRVNEAYKSYGHNYVDEKPEAAVTYDFENNSLDEISGAAFTTGASLTNDSEKGGRVLYIDGTADSYMEFDAPRDENGNVLEEYTVSFDVKNQTTGNYFNFYIGDGSSNANGINYLGVKAADKILVSAKNSSTEKKTTLIAAGVQNNWHHFDVVVSNGITQVYVDNDLKGSLEGYMMSEINASKIRFGFSAWSADTASKAYYDNITVYPAALSEAAIIGTENMRPVIDKDAKGLLFAANFNDENTDAVKGKVQLYGNASYGTSDDGSKALYLDGSSYLSLTNDNGTPLLASKDNIVVTMRVKTEQNTTSGWYFYTAPDNTAQVNTSRKYVGLFNNYTNMIAERFKNDSGTPTVTADASVGAWKEVTLVIAGNKQELYVDGQSAGSVEYDYTLSQILGADNGQITYIGKANWGRGEFFKGYIDDIAIYNFAPLADIEDASNIKSDITLPTAIEEKDGYSLTWESSDKSVISDTGKVTRPQMGKKKVKLTTAIKFGNTTLEKIIDVTVKGYEYYDMSLTVSGEKGVDIQPNMYGLFFEDISYAADGGLSAEKIENRNFEQIWQTNKNYGTTATAATNPGYAWTATGTVTYPASGDDEYSPLNGKNPTYAHFTGTKLSNAAYQGVYAKNGDVLKISLYAKSDSFKGSISAGVDGQMAELVPSNGITNEWTKYTASLTMTKDVRYKPFDIILSESGTVDFDMISCIPSDAIYGVFRKDLADKLKDLNPGFLRFPGGCIIEGLDLANRYQWKNSVGPIEERTQNWTRWGGAEYNQTLAIGYFEYLELCEYLNCDPVPVLNVGLSCEYNRPKETVPVYASQGSGDAGVTVDGVIYSTEFYGYIQDALDLIEFCNGMDFSNEWASLRKSMGHEESFNLTMLGIGNEQWQISGNQWHERYEAFESVIHKYYPDIKLISTSGPSSDDRAPDWDFSNAWNWIREKKTENDSFTYATDEHYYNDSEWFFGNTERYDSYTRNAKVFAGEYAANGTYGNTLYSALAEAAFMTGLERNADVVYMASYAPLFCREGYSNWAPNMIWFDDATSYVKPDYYTQNMFMNNNGDYTLKSTMDKLEDENYYQSCSYDEESGDVIVKIVNPYENTTLVNIDLSQIKERYGLTGTTNIITLTGDSKAATNTAANPDNVKTVSSEMNNGETISYDIPELSFVIFRIQTEKKEIAEKPYLNLTASNKNGNIEYSVTTNIKNGDLYTALYDEDGTLKKMTMNNKTGVFDNLENGTYTVKSFIWDNMKPLCDAASKNVTAGEIPDGLISLSKSTFGNPITGFDRDGNMVYAGDPAPMVDGDTVYLYVGHDVASGGSYSMPNWLVYSSKDLTEWKYEGVVLEENQTAISWANSSTTAWAAQAVKHNGKYYFYYCTTSNQANGQQCIGAAVSDSPTGPFKDIGHPLVNAYALGLKTAEQGWYTIDPTVWIDKDSNGDEHIYLNWGNTYNITCELNSDMISVKDISGDGKITKNDFVDTTIESISGDYPEYDFREAPWIYRRQDENGNYYGKYYMFFANGWREHYSYAVTDDPMSGKWKYMGDLMDVTATSNTSHGGVFDFGGKTYYLYHNGSLPGGSGYRRVANIQELTFNDDGTIDKLTELSTGINGWSTSLISANGNYMGHEQFTNSKSDSDYPISKNVTSGAADGYNTEWEIKPGKADAGKASYVSLQSVNKPGLYICEQNGHIVLTQDVHDALSKEMTFITHKALNGNKSMVSFESLSKPGYYLTDLNGAIELSNDADVDKSSFGFDSDMAKLTEIVSVSKSYAELFPDSSSSVQDKYELITDGTFDKTASFAAMDWSFKTYNTWYSGGSIAADGGNKYASLTGTGIGQNVAVENDVTYTLTADVKSTGTTSLCIQNGDAAYPGTQPANTLVSVDVTGSDWHTVTLEYTNESNLGHFFVYLWSENGVKTDIDNVSLTASGLRDKTAGSWLLYKNDAVKIISAEGLETVLVRNDLTQSDDECVTVELTVTNIPYGYDISASKIDS